MSERTNSFGKSPVSVCAFFCVCSFSVCLRIRTGCVYRQTWWAEAQQCEDDAALPRKHKSASNGVKSSFESVNHLGIDKAPPRRRAPFSPLIDENTDSSLKWFSALLVFCLDSAAKFRQQFHSLSYISYIFSLIHITAMKLRVVFSLFSSAQRLKRESSGWPWLQSVKSNLSLAQRSAQSDILLLE